MAGKLWVLEQAPTPEALVQRALGQRQTPQHLVQAGQSQFAARAPQPQAQPPPQAVPTSSLRKHRASVFEPTRAFRSIFW